MNKYIESLLHKKIAVVGCGKTGISGAKYLLDKCALVKLFDDNENLSDDTRLFITKNGVGLSKISDEILLFDMIYLSPGVPRSLTVFQKAVELGIEIVNDVELLYRIKPDVKIIAITGSNGKTTTTTLVGEVFKEFFKTAVAGNIGTPILDIIDEEYEIFVLELSSFQIESLTEFKSDVALILNITPDHLDRYESMEHYADTKRKLARMMKPSGCVILNRDDKNLDNIAFSNIKRFSSTEKSDIYIDGDAIIYGENRILLDDIFIKGVHNYENVMSTILASQCYQLDFDKVKKCVCEFRGVEHRLEFVKNVNGVSYYNDSKATNPDSVVSALKSFEKNIVWLAGGRSKNTPFDDIYSLAKNRVKKAIFFGESREEFLNSFETLTDCIVISNLEDAIKYASKIAVHDDVVVLSPGCTSFDAYTSYTKRGEHFKRVVGELIED